MTPEALRHLRDALIEFETEHVEPGALIADPLDLVIREISMVLIIELQAVLDGR